MGRTCNYKATTGWHLVSWIPEFQNFSIAGPLIIRQQRIIQILYWFSNHGYQSLVRSKSFHFGAAFKYSFSNCTYKPFASVVLIIQTSLLNKCFLLLCLFVCLFVLSLYAFILVFWFYLVIYIYFIVLFDFIVVIILINNILFLAYQ